MRGGAGPKTVYQHSVYGSDGMPVFINDMLDVVEEETSPHLAGKPKLFFIQVCAIMSVMVYDYMYCRFNMEPLLHVVNLLLANQVSGVKFQFRRPPWPSG